MKLCYKCFLDEGLKEFKDLPNYKQDKEEWTHEKMLSLFWEYPILYTNSTSERQQIGETRETCKCNLNGLFVREVNFQMLRKGSLEKLKYILKEREKASRIEE